MCPFLKAKMSLVGNVLHDKLFISCTKCVLWQWPLHIIVIVNMSLWIVLLAVWLSPGGAGGKGVWGAAGMVYEDEEPDARDPNYDESAQVSECSRLVSIWILDCL